MTNLKKISTLLLVIFGVGALVFFTKGAQIAQTLSTFGLTAQAQAPAEIYVSVNGSDSGTGTAASPFKTVDKGVERAAALGGGTVFVRGEYGSNPNTYPETKETLKHSVSSNPPITIKPYGDNVITFTGQAGAPIWKIESPNITIEGENKFVFDGTGIYSDSTGAVILIYEADNVSISGVTVKNSGGRGISYYDADNITVKNSTVFNIRKRAIGGSGNNILIEGNTVHDSALVNENGDMCGQGGWAAAISTLSQNAPGGVFNDGVTIKNNTIYNNWGEGISAFDSKNVKILNNKVYNNYSVNIYLDRTENATVIGNHVYQDFNHRPKTCGSSPRQTRSILIANEDWATTTLANNILIANNVLQGGHSGIGYWQDTSYSDQRNTYSNIVIAHNVIFNPDKYGIDFDSVSSPYNAPSNIHLLNNIIDGGSSGSLKIGGGNFGAWTISNNHWVDAVPTGSQPSLANNTTGDPQYLGQNLAIGSSPENFKISNTSPAASSGTTTAVIPEPVRHWSVAYVANDYFGIPFSTTTPSRGLHEASGTAPTPTPTPTPTASPSPSPSTNPGPVLVCGNGSGGGSTPTPAPPSSGVVTGFGATDTKSLPSAINEASGQARSFSNANHSWLLNDGNANRIFLVSNNDPTSVIKQYKIDAAGVTDVESMANDKGTLFIGDTGCNSGCDNKIKTIYIAPEPPANTPNDTALPNARLLRFQFPERDEPDVTLVNYLDVEALMVDASQTNANEPYLFVVPKADGNRHDDGRKYAYYLTKNDIETKSGAVGTTPAVVLLKRSAEPVRIYPDNPSSCNPNEPTCQTKFTSGDISPDGKHVVLRVYNTIYYWQRRSGEAILSTLTRTPDHTVAWNGDWGHEAMIFNETNTGFFSSNESPSSRQGKMVYYPFIISQGIAPTQTNNSTNNSCDIKINFETTDTTTPAGYFRDSGETIADRGNGYTYGWTSSNTSGARKRDTDSDVRKDTLNHMQNNLSNKSWEIELPNGEYNVTISAGDPDWTNSYYKIAAENTLVVDFNAEAPGNTQHWAVNTKTVSVTDGKLTISNAEGSDNNKINYIEITPATGESLCSQANLNDDTVVNTLDKNILLQNLFSTTPNPSRADINGDGVVNMLDYSFLMTHFGDTCS